MGQCGLEHGRPSGVRRTGGHACAGGRASRHAGGRLRRSRKRVRAEAVQEGEDDTANH
jgi:hypothetical protein